MLDGEPLSPELVLVSPALAERARSLLPDRFADLIRDPVAVPVPDSDCRTPPKPLEHTAEFVDGLSRRSAQADRRIARLEHAVWRIEAALVSAAAPPPPGSPERLDEPAGGRTGQTRPRVKRTRSGLTGTIAFVASVIAAMVAVELLPSVGDRPRLGVVSEGANPAATTTRSVQPASTSAPPTTTSDATALAPRRVFVWPAVEGATAYAVSFVRNGSRFFSAVVVESQLELPESIRFPPGSYGWIVQPRAGTRDLGPPIVDSNFSVAPR
jgi:hypothetical protein